MSPTFSRWGFSLCVGRQHVARERTWIGGWPGQDLAPHVSCVILASHLPSLGPVSLAIRWAKNSHLKKYWKLEIINNKSVQCLARTVQHCSSSIKGRKWYHFSFLFKQYWFQSSFRDQANSLTRPKGPAWFGPYHVTGLISGHFPSHWAPMGQASPLYPGPSNMLCLWLRILSHLFINSLLFLVL